MAPAQTRLDQIRDLVNQWEQLVGYTVTVPDWMVYEMADKQTSAGWVTNMFTVGQYMKDHTAPGQYNLAWMDAPFQQWAWYGMSATEYQAKLEAFDTVMRNMTGSASPQNAGQGDLIDRALKEHQGSMTGAQFQQWLLSQDSITKTYGWLKYGLDYNQFQQQKLQMRTAFGRDLTDQEATAQLQFWHAAQGPSASVGVVPTLSQQEKKQANQGVGQSEVR